MWVLTQILAMLAITAKQTAYRLYGWSWVVALVIAGLLIVIECSLWHSFRSAPSFFKVWFLGTSVLALFGFGMTFLYFKETPTPLHIVGAVLAIAGAVLLVWK